jgi:TraY domain
MPRKANPAQLRYPLNLRMNAEQRAQLEAAAKVSGRSLTQEATARLARSFDQDATYGDPEVRRVAVAMSVAFSLAGQHYSDGRPGWTKNRDAYLAGMRGVIDALLTGIPDVTDREIWLEIECLKSSLLTRIAQRRLREQEQAEPPAA